MTPYVWEIVRQDCWEVQKFKIIGEFLAKMASNERKKVRENKCGMTPYVWEIVRQDCWEVQKFEIICEL